MALPRRAAPLPRLSLGAALLALSLGILSLAAARPAPAQTLDPNLVTCPGFESSAFSGWTVSGGAAFVPGTPPGEPDDVQYLLGTLHAVATSSSTPLRFKVANTDDFTALDDVRVAAVPEAGPLPLPSLPLNPRIEEESHR